MAATISRAAYAQMYGPTVGDRVRLAPLGDKCEIYGFQQKAMGKLWKLNPSRVSPIMLFSLHFTKM